MTVGANRYRKLGRHATRKDKNGRPMPVRADRDRIMTWFFELLRHHPDFGSCNSAETKDSLDSTTHCTTMRIATHRPEHCVASSAYHCVILSMSGASTTGYWESCIRRHTSPGSPRMWLTMR